MFGPIIYEIKANLSRPSSFYEMLGEKDRNYISQFLKADDSVIS